MTQHSSFHKNNFFVVTTFFNPCKYKSHYEKYCKFRNNINKQTNNLITIELGFGPEHAFEIEGSVRVHTNSILWHKERLINIVIEKYLPKYASGICWVDSDILFDNDDWIQQTCNQMNRGALAIQPFSLAIFLNSLDKAEKMLEGLAYQRRNTFNFWKYNNFGFTGLSWAFPKSFIDKVGIYDRMIIGGFDSFFTDCLYKTSSNFYPVYPEMKEYKEKFNNVLFEEPSYIRGKAIHLYHGKIENRNYIDRHQILKNNNFDPKTDLLKNEDGVYEFTKNKPNLVKEVSNYFLNRKEDS